MRNRIAVVVQLRFTLAGEITTTFRVIPRVTGFSPNASGDYWNQLHRRDQSHIRRSESDERHHQLRYPDYGQSSHGGENRKNRCDHAMRHRNQFGTIHRNPVVVV